MASGLPLTAPVERYAALRAALDKAAFLAALPGPAVLIRLDERGGDDEPAPWAFHGSGLPFPVHVPSSDEDVFLSMEQTPSDPSLPRPISKSGEREDSDEGPRPRQEAKKGRRRSALKGAAKGGAKEATQEASPDDRTATGPMFSISVPPARGRATVHVVPHGQELIIGRDRGCDVVVPERSISKRHARLMLEATRVEGTRAHGTPKPTLTVVDLGSQNGVAVNGRRLRPGGQDALRSGDVLDLGDVSLLLLEASEFFDGLPRLTDG